jgi:hypothetical protein
MGRAFFFFVMVFAIAACGYEKATSSRAEDFASLCAMDQTAIRDVLTRDMQICFQDHGSDFMDAGELVRTTNRSRASWISTLPLTGETITRSEVAGWGVDAGGNITFFTTREALSFGDTSVRFPDIPFGCMSTEDITLERDVDAEAAPGARYSCIWRVQAPRPRP